MNIKTRDIVFVLIGLVCLFSALTGDAPAKFVTASLKGKKPEYKQIKFPDLSQIQLGGGTPKANNSSLTAFPIGTSGAAETACKFALAQVGKPYKWGATGPDSFDCSGLAYASYAAAGISIPRTTYAQAAIGTPISKANLLPGDLVFPDPGHVQIYLGNGKVVESPHTGAFVQVVNMWGFWIARRVTSGGVISV